jgi:predicted transposase YbfD/YdcC
VVVIAVRWGCWQIENTLHRTKDVTLGEDQSTLHQGQGPTIMAHLRDAARRRDHSQDPASALALVIGAPPPQTRV